MKWSSVSLSVLGCFLFSLTAWAGEDKQPPPRQDQEKEKPAATSQPAKQQVKANDVDAFIKRFDHNGDGCLEKNELPMALRVCFVEWDADKDGKLSRDELAKHEDVLKHWMAMAERRRERLILAGGFLSQLASSDDPGREIIQGVYGVLQQMDTNQDGKIDREEWQAAQKKLSEMRVDALLRARAARTASSRRMSALAGPIGTSISGTSTTTASSTVTS